MIRIFMGRKFSLYIEINFYVKHYCNTLYTLRYESWEWQKKIYKSFKRLISFKKINEWVFGRFLTLFSCTKHNYKKVSAWLLNCFISNRTFFRPSPSPYKYILQIFCSIVLLKLKTQKLPVIMDGLIHQVYLTVVVSTI